MPANLNKPELWKYDITKSVDMYNNWFTNFAPVAFRETRAKTTKDVEDTLQTTGNLTDVKATLLRQHPRCAADVAHVDVPAARG